MTVHEVAKQVMKDSKTTQQEIADAAGLASAGAVWNWLSGKSMRVDSLVKLLDRCGYDLIVRDRSGENASYRISNEEGIDVVECNMKREEEPNDMDKIRRLIADEFVKRGLESGPRTRIDLKKSRKNKKGR